MSNIIDFPGNKNKNARKTNGGGTRKPLYSGNTETKSDPYPVRDSRMYYDLKKSRSKFSGNANNQKCWETGAIWCLRYMDKNYFRIRKTFAIPLLISLLSIIIILGMIIYRGVS